VRPSTDLSKIVGVNENPNVVVVEGDLLDVDTLVPILEDVDTVIHCAANMDFYPKDVNEMFKVNVEGSKNLYAAAIQCKARLFVYVSSTESLGPSAKGDERKNENSEFKPAYVYGESKVVAENEIKKLYEESDKETKYVILKPTGIYGPGEKFSMYQVIWSVNIGLFFFVPSNTGKLTYTHIDDIVSGIIATLRCKSPDFENQSYILSADNPVTYEEALRIICRNTGRIDPFVKFPYPIVRFSVLLIKSIFNRFFDTVFLFHEKTVDQMMLDRYYDNSSAKQKLGWKPKYNFEEGIKDTCNYYFKNKTIKKYKISPIAKIFLVLILFIIFYVFFQINYLIFVLVKGHPSII